MTDRARNETVYYYNGRGNVSRSFDTIGTAAAGSFQTNTKYEYTASGKHIDKPTKVSQLIGWNAGEAIYATTETNFGTETIVSPNNASIAVDVETVVDPVKNKTANYTDGYGRLVKSTQYKPIGENQYVELASTWNTYDSEGGLLLVTETTTGSGSNLKRHSFTANIYDGRNRLLAYGWGGYAEGHEFYFVLYPLAQS